ncbi:hypothetical protein [Mangrovibacillus cuniculi]|uniref:Uncharacterized protein n=1 Tax=Mangrovibacillus cuniculi TaxID=2593652 RepID=A0A7S8CB09_9BACI|nr:hypothetical protein [Mangrovibacillus cuniculi]QPC46653.1 hypothetical protein G8O30_06595 [Mangrovibacillus cuniculi]
MKDYTNEFQLITNALESATKSLAETESSHMHQSFALAKEDWKKAYKYWLSNDSRFRS